MSSTPTRNISLTTELQGYIRKQVATGHYSNASEVVRAGLRLLMERDQAVLRDYTTATKPSSAR
ncbi:putative addiction module CopG family antidote [Methylobacterium sp. BE186]|uniref:type II toxin-antitoxin system ParD family antitoxin n=1 Tax=Methylobacterium sp. BE186 TaxID=2817715 RepID=UPI0028545C50|nr:type II toxin-antitoxin system ParD family antitoxin [Methylobacterium sp. BE186]MDR7040296.1 putative addiction module CopG family antidote [Methylobacterium sp. BE186]